MTIKEIVEATGGTLLCGDENQVIEHVSIDSRNSQGNDIFVPIIGKKSDAHRFIGAAVDAGCVATFTSEHNQAPEGALGTLPWIRVDDTVTALQETGKLWREHMHMPVVAVTGSVGKTTTREMVAAALAAEKKVYKTIKNYNSIIGLPVMLTEMTKDYDIAVLEMGMNAPGEIACMTRLAQPDMAIVTNIGVAHMEFFGSQEGIRQEKLSVRKGLKGGFLLLNGDDPLLCQETDGEQDKVVFYGQSEGCQYRACHVENHNGFYSFVLVHGQTQIPVQLAVPGIHNVNNAAAALAAADLNGISMAAAAQALAQFTGFSNRLQIFEKNGYTLIDDTYNASPDSMKAGLNVLLARTASRYIAVLGDMKELGEQSARFHYEIGTYMKDFPIEQVVLVGELAQEIGKALQDAHSAVAVHAFEQKEDAAAYLKEIVRAGDVVYVKASNSMGLKQIVQELHKDR